MKNIKKNVIKSIDRSTHGLGVDSILFIVGILIIFIGAGLSVFASSNAAVVSKAMVFILLIIGIAIGVMNISQSETVSFLIAAVVLVMLLGPYFGNLIQVFQLGGEWSQFIGEIFKNVINLIVPAALIVAFKTFILVSKDDN